ncbi:DUF6007 family protein [Staphylococcus delphini]|uniref:DUF6007 family protein n=1 Tax=Staphylococcus delphini TaxID=53344 RepID=UPI0015C7A15C|nr:DUF6007 family protein [Staphylococcus delphini]
MENIEKELKRYVWVYIISIIPMSFIIKVLPKDSLFEVIMSLIIVVLSSIGLSTVVIYILYLRKKGSHKAYDTYVKFMNLKAREHISHLHF